MKILIKVTKDILIRSAMCGSDHTIYSNCAIALAVREIFPHAFVNAIHMRPVNNVKIALPISAVKFIRKFDYATPEERVMMPELSFEIDVPSRLIEQIGISEVYRVLSESRTLELVHP